jgi:hypothetical protein
MRVYTNHKTTIDHDTPIPAGKKMSPLTQLYGVHGIYSTHEHGVSDSHIIGTISSKVKDEKLKKREKQWKSRLITTENLEQTKRKEIRESRKTNDSLKSQDTSPQVFSSSSNVSMHNSNSNHDRHSQILQSPQTHRVDDPEMTENDLIANGAYYLSPEQLKTYQDFTELLASFDNYDMVRRLYFLIVVDLSR